MEEILLQNSKNITSLINLMKVHEENIKRYRKETHEDIDILMKTNLYIECEYSSLLNSNVKMCPIDRSYFIATDKVVLVRECGHVFKREPFFEWATSHMTCPRCSAKIV
jgi:hypothetical protein